MDLIDDRRFRAACLVLWLAGWMITLWLSLRPAPSMPFGWSDKTWHAGGYALMTTFAAFCCPSLRLFLGLALLSVLAGAGIEGLQLLVPSRSFELLDMAANASGAMVGAGLGSLWFLLLAQRQRPRPA